jgi:hypothetical protein
VLPLMGSGTVLSGSILKHCSWTSYNDISNIGVPHYER